MKRLLYIILSLTIFISLPIYAATRILLPEWLADKISTSLPEGATLSIGNISSNSDLSIVYENVIFSLNNFSAAMPELIVMPNLNIKNPIIITSNKMNLKINENEIDLIGSEIKVFLGERKLNNFRLNGKISSLESSVELLASNIDFLILGLLDQERKISLSSEKAFLKLSAPLGHVGIVFENVTSSITLDKEFGSNLKAELVELDLGGLYASSENKIFYAESLETDLKFFKKSEWLLPLSFQVNNIRHQNENMFDSVHFSGVGRWEPRSQNCNFYDIKNSFKECGKLIDFLGMNLVFEEGLGQLAFKGNGYCVAPKSGCRQRIDANIVGRNTADVFSTIMRSGTLNPLIGGILLGSMLSSPSEEGSEYDHSIELAVEGSQVFINGEPLIK